MTARPFIFMPFEDEVRHPTMLSLLIKWSHPTAIAQSAR